MYKKILNIGDKFGEWEIISLTEKRHHGHLVYRVKCSCGSESEKDGYYLRTKKSEYCRSCSAKKRIPKGKDHKFYKHGATLAENPIRPTYKVWVSMKQRCRDQNCKEYINYGGRGITISKEWEDFEVFLKDMGACPEGLSLDRIDNNGNYCKENCRWVTRKIQNNNRRDNTIFMIDGLRVTRTQIQEKLGLTRDMYRRRFESKGIDWLIDEFKKRSENS